MKLTLHHHFTVGEPATEEEISVLRDLLYFKDPNAASYPEYRDKTWDGMRDFFLDVEQSIFPTGFLRHVLVGLAREGIQPEILDERTPVPLPTGSVEPDMLDGITLRPYQLEMIQEALRMRRGVIQASPRSGKTEAQIAVASMLNVPSGLFVEKAGLMNQHYERFLERGIRDVGRLGEGRRELDRLHVVATFQTIWSAIRRKDEEILAWLDQIELAQCDEVHHLGSAITYYRSFSRCPAPYRIGWSGTPFRVAVDEEKFNYADFAMMGATGKMIFQVTSRLLRDEGYMVEPMVYMIKITKPSLWSVKNWQNTYRQGIVQNEQRNEIIVKLAKMLHDAGERTLILIRELKHGEFLLQELVNKGVPCVMASGGNRITTALPHGSLRRTGGGTAKIREMMDAGSLNTVVGSVIFDEGVDIPAISSLIIASGGRSSIKAIQRAFRAMTVAEGKTKSHIFDFNDNINFMLRNQSSERMEVYREEDIDVVTQLPHKFKRKIGAP